MSWNWGTYRETEEEAIGMAKSVIVSELEMQEKERKKIPEPTSVQEISKNIKKEMEKICKEMGMSMTTAFTVFATKKRIPFEITAAPFYSESNMKYLEKVISDIETGKAKLEKHELIEG